MSNTVIIFSSERGAPLPHTSLAIRKCIANCCPGVNVIIASYGPMVALYKKGIHVVDLELQEGHGFIEAMDAARRLMQQLRPILIIAHEEFPPIVAARVLEIKVLYFGSWLPSLGTIAAESLQSAHAILVEGSPGIFPCPPRCEVKILHCGKLMAPMEAHSGDRASMRAAIGLTELEYLVSVFTLFREPEKIFPIAPIIIPAFAAICKNVDARLVWFAQRDVAFLVERLKGIAGARVLDDSHMAHALIAASDLVVTRGSRALVEEVAEKGVRSISLSFGAFPHEDVLIAARASNRPMNARAITSEVLADSIIIHAKQRYNNTKTEVAVENAPLGDDVLCREVTALIG